MKLNGVVWSSISAVIATLFAGNMWFAGRMVDRLDSLELSVWQLKQNVAVLEATISRSSFQRSNLSLMRGHLGQESLTFRTFRLIP